MTAPRVLGPFYRRAQALEVFFRSLDAENTLSPFEGNARYVALQAKEYAEAMKLAGQAPEEDRAALLAHGRSEAARILAILLRDCIAHGWDLLEVLTEGIEYEQEVRRAIESGERGRRSHRGLEGA